MLGRRGFTLGLAAGAAGALPGTAGAQSSGPAAWPNRPLRWLVGYPPGGPSDVFARLTGAHIAARLGQSVLVENRPGGGAVLASEAVARSAPDGYTMLHVDNGILVYNPAIYSRLPYDPDRDLQGVGFIGRFPLFIVVRPDDPARDFAGFVERSKARAPNYGSPAVASPHHLAMEMVKRRTGLQANHVPYRGGPSAMQDLLAGQIEAVMIDCATGIPFIADGRVRALCALSEARSPRAPAVPTLRELGVADAVALWLARHERADRGAGAGAGAVGGGAPRGGRGGGCAGALRVARHRKCELEPGGVRRFRPAREFCSGGP